MGPVRYYFNSYNRNNNSRKKMGKNCFLILESGSLLPLHFQPPEARFSISYDHSHLVTTCSETSALRGSLQGLLQPAIIIHLGWVSPERWVLTEFDLHIRQRQMEERDFDGICQCQVEWAVCRKLWVLETVLSNFSALWLLGSTHSPAKVKKGLFLLTQLWRKLLTFMLHY